MNRIPIGIVLAGAVGLASATLAMGLAGATGPRTSSGPPPRFDHFRGASVAGVKTAGSIFGFETTERRFTKVLARKVRVPDGQERLAIITFSSECTHEEGDASSYTSVEAAVNRHGDRTLASPNVGQEFIFCSDSGSDSPASVSASQTWVTTLSGGVNTVFIRFASVGGGTAQLRYMTMVVNSYKHPCCSPG